jgi:hypothetical protein
MAEASGVAPVVLIPIFWDKPKWQITNEIIMVNEIFFMKFSFDGSLTSGLKGGYCCTARNQEKSDLEKSGK